MPGAAITATTAVFSSSTARVMGFTELLLRNDKRRQVESITPARPKRAENRANTVPVKNRCLPAVNLGAGIGVVPLRKATPGSRQ